MADKKFWSTWALAAICIFLQPHNASSANILALFPLASRSHNNIFSPITLALVEKGHSFTVITSHPIQSPPKNYHQIDVHYLVGHYMERFNGTSKRGLFEMLREFRSMTVDSCKEVMGNEEVKSLVKPKNGERFDMILMGNFFTECFYPFARIYNAPIVLISPSGPMPNTHHAVGNVVLPSYYAEVAAGYSDRMNLKERVVNTLAHVGLMMAIKFYVKRATEQEMRKAFGEDTPTISELEEYVSLAVVNNHFSMNQARSLVPSLIEAGGLHIKPPKELPKDLKEFMDGAGENGVIYFSLGTIVKSVTFSKDTRDELLAAFSKVKQRVLWKWEGENPLPDQPQNVRLEKWLPQQDVLAHPNTKLFITHGGLLSFQEATSRGVPLVGIPYLGDQAMNMERVLDLQVGMKLDADNLTEINILNAINEVLGNPVYSTNMKKLSTIMNDQKDNPLDRAIFWIEYVIRHKGAKHLKPAAFYLRWYEIYMLDVIFLVVVLPSIILTILGLIGLKLIKKICKSKRKTVAIAKKTE